jgi:hypothetical protein
MEDGTVDALELVVAMAVKIPAGLALLGWDERRLARKAPELLERAWPPSTRLSAMVVFQEIGILVHFWRTRRWSPAGLSLGIGWAIVYLFATSLPLVAIDALLRDG